MKDHLDYADPEHVAKLARILSAATGALLHDEQGICVDTQRHGRFIIYRDKLTVLIQDEVPPELKHGETVWMSDHPQQ